MSEDKVYDKLLLWEMLRAAETVEDTMIHVKTEALRGLLEQCSALQTALDESRETLGRIADGCADPKGAAQAILDAKVS